MLEMKKKDNRAEMVFMVVMNCPQHRKADDTHRMIIIYYMLTDDPTAAAEV
jgi:hypothetical protein